mgnify:CR=1 FL=1
MACHLEKSEVTEPMSTVLYAQSLLYANSLAFQSSLKVADQVFKAACGSKRPCH